MAKRLTDVPGASEGFLGGVVAYHNRVKESSLGVPDATLASCGAVSREAALEMARGVARALGADFGVGITGVAGPGGGTEEKPVGTVWLAVHGPSGEVVRRERFPGDRGEVRERATQAALFLLLRFLDGRVAPDDPDADGGTPHQG